MNQKQFLVLCREKYRQDWKRWGSELWSTLSLTRKRSVTADEVREDLPSIVRCMFEFDFTVAMATTLDQIRNDVGRP